MWIKVVACREKEAQEHDIGIMKLEEMDTLVPEASHQGHGPHFHNDWWPAGLTANYFIGEPV